jgi:hypothetical protein
MTISLTTPIKLTLATLLSAVMMAATLSSLLPSSASAQSSGSSFNAGRIIDDAVFFNSNSMTVAQIQSFLNARVPECDTWGQKMYNSTQTRAQWAAANNRPAPPYTCLRNFTQTVPTVTNGGSNLCTGSISGGNKSGAQIIYDVSKACGINPQTLIVMLQKEMSLVSDDWPWPRQYEIAMGYGCPDSGENYSANCSSDYYGFFNQVYQAAQAFRRYEANPTWYNYRAGRNNTIQFNPDPACGSSTVFIQNQATANLYIYTPYQPNAATLAAAPGQTVPCGAYGNLNFWRMFNNWFGNTYNSSPYAWSLVSQQVFIDSARTVRFSNKTAATPGQELYMRIVARNTGAQAWDSSFVRLGTSRARDRQSIFQHESWVHPARPTAMQNEEQVLPGQQATFEFVLKAPVQPGTYREYFNLVAEARTWMNDFGLYYPIDVVVPAQPANTNNSLRSGNSLNRNEYLLSADRNSILKLQPNGNLQLITNHRVVWQSDTANSGAVRLNMQGDGNLVLYTDQGQAVWHTSTMGNSNASLSLQTDGNLVLYANAQPIWNSATVHRPNLLGYVNDTISMGRLYPGQTLQTANRMYRLVLQSDGNLVLYSDKRALWASQTVGSGAAFLSMQGDGNLVLYDNQNRAVWHSRTPGQTNVRLAVQPDGNLVLYEGLSRPIWHTRTNGMR